MVPLEIVELWSQDLYEANGELDFDIIWKNVFVSSKKFAHQLIIHFFFFTKILYNSSISNEMYCWKVVFQMCSKQDFPISPVLFLLIFQSKPSSQENTTNLLKLKKNLKDSSKISY